MTEVTNEDINVSTWKIPSPLGIIGSHAEGEFNGMTASWITQVSMEPALIGVGIDNKSVTFEEACHMTSKLTNQRRGRENSNLI